MYDKEARHVIEALRSGIPSRAVGQYFSEARPQIMRRISGTLENVCDSGQPEGMVISGKYGEGKTHLLNTVFNMAHDDNMVVSFLSISKETPMDKLYLVFQKAMMGTFLPGRTQPGFARLLEEMSPNSPIASELLTYAATELETDRLFYVLKAYLNTEDQDEKYQLMSDLEGDFVSNPVIRKIYRRVFHTPAKFNVNFRKTAHAMDYFKFMSHLFVKLGFNGWVILMDEAELIGRLGKKTRLKAYFNMAKFLMPDRQMESVFSMFALSSSYVEDVIDGKHEYENLAEVYGEDDEPAKSVLDLLTKASQLLPLTKEEMQSVMENLREFHGKAYNWQPDVSMETIWHVTKSGGYLLRTQIRAAIELLDQVYQYGETGNTRIDELGKESFEEDVPSLDDIVER